LKARLPPPKALACSFVFCYTPCEQVYQKRITKGANAILMRCCL
jgi:hypothetical protein